MRFCVTCYAGQSPFRTRQTASREAEAIDQTMFRFLRNRNVLWIRCLAHILVGEPVPPRIRSGAGFRRTMRERTRRGAPKRTAHSSDRERHALGRHDRSGTRCGGLGGDAVEEAVVVIGIVMEDRYLADVRHRREPNAFLPARMAPTDAG